MSDPTDILTRIKDHVKSIDDTYYTWGDVADELGGEVVVEELASRTRWSVWYNIILKFGDVYVQVTHEDGATEYQDHGYSIADEVNSLKLVEPYEKTVIAYRRVSND